jgi:hypothetical protein
MSTAVTAKIKRQYDQGGSIPKMAVTLPGCVGLASASSETVANYCESPFGEDVVILEAYMDITTVDAQDADLDIGVADDAIGTSAEDNIFDSPANDTATVLRGLIVAGVAGVACPIWKAKGAATNSFITTQQNGNVDSAALVYNLILVVAPISAFNKV